MKGTNSLTKRIISCVLSFALCSGFFTPVFADAVDTVGSKAGEESVLTGETPADTQTPAETDTDTPVETEVEAPADTPVDTETETPTDTEGPTEIKTEETPETTEGEGTKEETADPTDTDEQTDPMKEDAEESDTTEETETTETSESTEDEPAETEEQDENEDDEANATSGKIGANISWKLSSAGVLTISGTGKMNDFRPYSMQEYYMYPPYNRKDYDTIPFSPFLNSKTIKSIVIQKGVTNIGLAVFDGCENVTSVEIPDSVTEIKPFAFEYCLSLKSINIPKSVTKINERAFLDCTALKEITIPGSVTYVGISCFRVDYSRNTPQLQKVIISEGVTQLDNGAFWNSYNLKYLYLPSTLNKSSTLTFTGTNLQHIHIPYGTTSQKFLKLYPDLPTDESKWHILDKNGHCSDPNCPMGDMDISDLVGNLSVTSVAIGNLPQKTDYYLGDELDLTGGTLSVTYSTGLQLEIPMTDEDVTYSGFDSSKTGTPKISLKYKNKTVTFNVNVAVDPQNAPVTVGDMGYETLAQAVKSITGSGEYTITICRELTENSVTLPKAPAKITINSKNDGVIKTSSLTANCDLDLNCPLEGTRNGAKTALKGANDKTITILNNAELGAVTGAKTANLVIKNAVNAVSVTTFGNIVTDGDRSQLCVSDKVSAVNEFSGQLFMTTPLAKSTAQINTFKNGFIILMTGTKDAKTGNYILPKVTITDVTDNVIARVVGAKDYLIPDGQPIMYAGGKSDFCDKITVSNNTEAHPEAAGKIKAFMYGKEIRAEYADALTLKREENYSRNFPNFETLFNFINSDSAYNNSNNVYFITLNGDISPDKFILPTKAGKGINILGNGHTLTLPGISALSPKYDFTLDNLTLNNTKNGKETLLTLNAAPNSYLCLDVKSDIIKELKGTKTSELYIGKGDLAVQNINTFSHVTTRRSYVLTGGMTQFYMSNATLNVTGKVSGVGSFTGNLALITPKASCTAAIDTINEGNLYLTATDKDRNGNYIIPKATIKNVSRYLRVEIIDSGFNSITIPDGQPILYTSGKDDYKNKITVDNATESCSDTSKIGAFLNGKEYQAFYANALTLNCGSSIAGNYPNFDLLFAAIAKDNCNDWYEVALNCDMAPEKFALPTKAGNGLQIKGNDHELKLPGISSLSPKYDIELSYMNLTNADKKGIEKPISITSNKMVILNTLSFYGSIKADELMINDWDNGEPRITLTGIDSNILRTWADGTTSINIVQGGQYKVKDQVRGYPEPIDLSPYNNGYSNHGDLSITVVDKNFVPVTFPVGKVTVVFATFPATTKYGANTSELIKFTNNGGLVPYVKQNKLVVEPLSKEIKTSDVTYRALLIGEDNIYDYDRCTRNRGDVGLMNTMLNNIKGAEGGRFHITTAYDVSKQETLSLIDTAYAGADDNDVSLFFIATHGDDHSTNDNAGALLMAGGNNDMLQLKTLAARLKKVPGKVVVFIQACGSGAAIKDHPNGEEYEDDFDPDLFNQQVMDVFSEFDCYITSDDEDEANPKEFANNKFYVLTASDFGETCYGYEPGFGEDGKFYESHFNIFTYILVQGCGYYGKAWADTNKNKIVSIDELYAYLQQYATGFTGDEEQQQHVQMYPTDSKYPLFKVS